MQYFQNNPAPFEPVQYTEPAEKRIKLEEYHVEEVEIVECCYNLLQLAPEYFRNLWNWSLFVKKYSSHKDPEIRWIFYQCVAKLYGLTEKDKLELIAKTLTMEENRTFSLKYYIQLCPYGESSYILNSLVHP